MGGPEPDDADARLAGAGQADGRQVHGGTRHTGQFGTGHGSIAAARQMADAFLQSVSGPLAATRGADLPPSTVQDVLLVVSELVTNSIRHTAGPCVLSLRADDDSLRIAVQDSSRTLPQFFDPDPTRVGRHGWEIINQLCSRVRITPEPDGKLIEVWLPFSP